MASSSGGGDFVRGDESPELIANRARFGVSPDAGPQPDPYTHGVWAGEWRCPERGRCVFTVPVLNEWPPSNRGAGGGVSGTILAGLVDMAGVKVVQSLARQGESLHGTAELSISYMRVASGDVITATAQVLRKGKTMCFVDVEIADSQGRLACKGRIAYALSQPEDGSSTADSPFLHDDAWLRPTPFEHPEFSADVGVKERGHVRLRMHIDPAWLEAGLGGVPGDAARTASRLTKAGGLKGTILAALLDQATSGGGASGAVGTLARRGDVMNGHVELNLSYVRPAAGRYIDANAVVTRYGKGLAFAECTFTDDEGRTVANGRVVYSIGKAADDGSHLRAKV